jgi:hypothetical protein
MGLTIEIHQNYNIPIFSILKNLFDKFKMFKTTYTPFDLNLDYLKIFQNFQEFLIPIIIV